MHGALIIITDSKKNIFLQQRTSDAPISPNCWGLWGGGIEEGETPLQAAVRELQEELNIIIEPSDLQFFKKYDISTKEGKIVYRHVYCLRFNPEWKIILGEGKGYGFFSSDELSHISLIPRLKDFLPDLLVAINNQI